MSKLYKGERLEEQTITSICQLHAVDRMDNMFLWRMRDIPWNDTISFSNSLYELRLYKYGSANLAIEFAASVFHIGWDCDQCLSLFYICLLWG
mgnify:FL=1|jgi:hypothetical protein